jgi:hypothetical protein
MTTIYKILNPLNGEYVTANTIEECEVYVVDLAFNLLNHVTHNAPYSVIDIKEDGSQVWRNPQGEEIADFDKLKEEARVRVGKPLLSIPLTPVETLP